MGRGLGTRQREILSKLEAHTWTPLHELAEDPNDPNDMAKARSAVHGLERRGLVATIRDSDPNRLVRTTTVVGEVTSSFGIEYRAEENARVWFGIHVRLQDEQDAEQGRQFRRAIEDIEGLSVARE